MERLRAIIGSSASGIRPNCSKRVSDSSSNRRSKLRRASRFSSASSTLNFGVQSLQFRSGVVDFELPVDAALLGVGLVGPDPNLGLEQRQFADASVGQTLTAQTT